MLIGMVWSVCCGGGVNEPTLLISSLISVVDNVNVDFKKKMICQRKICVRSTFTCVQVIN